MLRLIIIRLNFLAIISIIIKAHLASLSLIIIKFIRELQINLFINK